MASDSKFVNISWGRADERGPLGQIETGGRKLARLDRHVARSEWPANGTIQSCRVTHDTQPNLHGKGVMFVIPVGPAVEARAWRVAEAERRAIEKREEFLNSLRAKAREGYREQRRLLEGDSFSPGYPSPSIRAEVCVQNGRAVLLFEETEISLPELGEGKELAEKMWALWPTRVPEEHRYWFGDEMKIDRALDRAKALSLRIESVERFVASTDPLVVEWSADTDIGRIVIARIRPQMEYVQEDLLDLPEVQEVLRCWAEDRLSKASSEPLSGLVEVSSYTSPVGEYVSPDERSTRTSGGFTYTVVKIGGMNAGSFYTHYGDVRSKGSQWHDARAELGLVPGAMHPGITPRQLLAWTLTHPTTVNENVPVRGPAATALRLAADVDSLASIGVRLEVEVAAVEAAAKKAADEARWAAEEAAALVRTEREKMFRTVRDAIPSLKDIDSALVARLEAALEGWSPYGWTDPKISPEELNVLLGEIEMAQPAIEAARLARVAEMEAAARREAAARASTPEALRLAIPVSWNFVYENEFKSNCGSTVVLKRRELADIEDGHGVRLDCGYGCCVGTLRLRGMEPAQKSGAGSFAAAFANAGVQSKGESVTFTVTDKANRNFRCSCGASDRLGKTTWKLARQLPQRHTCSACGGKADVDFR